MKKIVAIVTVVCWVPSAVMGMGTSGLSNEAAVGAKPLGMFNCVTAQADDPTAIYFNPSGLVHVGGWNMSVNDNILDIHMEREAFSGGKTKGESEPIHVPSLFLSFGAPSEKIAFGLGVHSTFGLETRWGAESFSKYTATTSKFHLVTINPTMAAALNEKWSFGFGVDYFRAFDVDLQKRLSVSAINGAPAPDGDVRFTADGDGWGVNVGTLYRINPKHSVGASYRSPVRLEINGSQNLSGMSGTASLVFGGQNYSSAASAKIDLPAEFIFGYAYRPIEKWVIESDVQWTGWSSVHDFGVQFSETNPTRKSILSAGVDPQTREWQDTVSFGVGTAYDLSRRWTARLGGGYLPRAVPEKTFDSSLPDANRYEATTGLTYKLYKTQFHFAYNAAWFETRSVSNNVTRGAINGTYRTFVNSWSLGIEQKF